MKRAFELPSPSSQIPILPVAGFSTTASRQLPGSTAPGAPGAQNRPVIASTTDRTGTAMLPLASLQQPAAGSANHAARQYQSGFSRPTAGYYELIKAKINEGITPWVQQGISFHTTEERNAYWAESLYIIAANQGAAGAWNAEAEAIIHRLGMAFLLDYKWPNKETLAHILACIKNSKWLQMALATASGKQSLHVRGVRGLTPLHLAAAYGRKKAVQLILQHDDDAGSIKLSQRPDGLSALHVAISNCNDSVVKALLSHGGKELRLVPNSYGYLGVHMAVKRRADADVLASLLAKCATEQALAQTKPGRNALMFAAVEGPIATIDMLLAIPGTKAAQLEARDNEGRRAIEHARHAGNHEVIARIEAAMQTQSATSTSSTAVSSLASAARQEPVQLAPVPLTPAPGRDPDFSETEEDELVDAN